ncbi:MAG: signal recognition particle-docking protein FtsY [Candidatus Sericytochromatia bacterium]
MSEEQAGRKKSLWKILNTPVQDLFKEDTWVEPKPGEAAVSSEPAAPGGISAAEPVSSEVLAVPVAEVPVAEISQATASVESGLGSEVLSEERLVTLTPAQEQTPEAISAAVIEEAEEHADSDESSEGDWLKSFKGMLWLGLGKEKERLPQQEKQSWLARFRERLGKSRSLLVDNLHRLAKGRTKVDEDMLEELEEILLQSDMGIATTDRVLDFLRGEAKKRRFLPDEVVPALMGYLEQEMQSEPFRIEAGKLNIFLVVGVNGTGKTTTVGKVAAKLKISGYKVMLAAGDTFRAAAIDQLAIWGKRVGCPVIRHHEGADAAAVVFDAIQSARARNVDVLLIDTAGRLHNKDHLMEELKKVHRIIEREKGDAHVENILVLDATTGQNGLRQADVFSKAVPLHGLILTKLDGTAKGGVVFAIRQELGIPIRLVGVGEHLEDLQEFEPKSFVGALLSSEEELEAAAAE